MGTFTVFRGTWPDNKMSEPKCGSKLCWGMSANACIVIGTVLVIVANVMGGCDCAGECVVGKECSQSFSGCESGDYDATKCVADPQCSNDACKAGGMDLGLMWSMFIIGVVLLVLGFVFCCCSCACCCFGQGAPPVGGVGAPVAKEVTI